MNPELSERLTTLLDYIGNTVKDADTFARGQAPLVAEEIVRWKIASSVLGVLLGISLGFVALWLFRIGKRNIKDADIAPPCIVFGGAFAAASIILVSINIYGAVRGITQPRVIVLDYIRSLK